MLAFDPRSGEVRGFGLCQGDVFEAVGGVFLVTYVVEQVEASDTDTFHYKVVYRPETLVPDIDMQASSQSGG